jgi:hypothetical protein
MLVRKEARSALVSLCENYWYPLYAYLRRRGYPQDQPQGLTQEFFIRVLEGRYRDRAHPEKGRFRFFLLSSLKFFVADVEDRDRTLKVAIHRLRNRYREIFRQEIADTGVNPAKVEAELRYLTIMLTRK